MKDLQGGDPYYMFKVETFQGANTSQHLDHWFNIINYTIYEIDEGRLKSQLNE